MKLPIANKLFILEELLERYHFSFFFSSQEQERETIDDETKSILKKSA